MPGQLASHPAVLLVLKPSLIRVVGGNDTLCKSNTGKQAMEIAKSNSLAAEIAAGDRLWLQEVAREFDIDPSGVLRWMSRGLRTANGARVQLEALLIGKRAATSRA